MTMHSDIEMPPLPKFLRRKRTKKDRELVDAILRQQGAKRSWAPIRKASEIPQKPTMPLLTDHPDLPVKVQVKGKQAGSTLLATYANMAEFEAKHNKSTYPVKGQPMLFNNHNVILVTAKPWADKEKNAVKREGPPKSAVRVRPASSKKKQADFVVYRSVLDAFEQLKLPVPRHQKFRAELKKVGALTFEHDGAKFEFETVK